MKLQLKFKEIKMPNRLKSPNKDNFEILKTIRKNQSDPRYLQNLAIIRDPQFWLNLAVIKELCLAKNNQPRVSPKALNRKQ